jgi:hypothetical protein
MRSLTIAFLSAFLAGAALAQASMSTVSVSLSGTVVSFCNQNSNATVSGDWTIGAVYASSYLQQNAPVPFGFSAYCNMPGISLAVTATNGSWQGSGAAAGKTIPYKISVEPTTGNLVPASGFAYSAPCAGCGVALAAGQATQLGTIQTPLTGTSTVQTSANIYLSPTGTATPQSGAYAESLTFTLTGP